MFFIKTPLILATIVVISLVQVGCAENPNRQQEIGAVAGLLLGGLVGSQIGQPAITLMKTEIIAAK